MKKIHLILFALSLTLLALSCSKEPARTEVPAASDRIVTIQVSIPEMTKVSGAYNGSALALTWAAGDKITISDHSNPATSEEFSLISGEGSKTAVFQGNEISASSYDIRYSNLPSGFAAQSQSADKNSEHLGFSLSLVGVNSYEDVSFTSAWASSKGGSFASSKGGSFASSGALHLSATLPDGVAATVSAVNFEASEAIFAGAKSLSVTLATPGDTDSDGVLDVFATLPGESTIPAGTEILVKFSTSDENHSVYTRYYKVPSAISLKEGKLSLISLDCTKTALYAGSPADDGSAEKPYLIADKYQLQAIKDAETGKYFKLVDDFDLSGSSWTSINGEDNLVVYLDGNGKTIRGLKKPLFSFFNGTISNLTLTNMELTVSGNYYGFLCRTIDKGTAAFTHVSIQNSTITSTGASAGGLIGRVDVDCSALTLTDCSATDITIDGSGHYAGALIALVNVPNVTIQRCYSSGTVSTAAGSGRHVGGLVGGINVGGAVIKDSYSTCTIHGYQFIGGLVGSVVSTGTVTLERCYASGEVSATKGNAGLGGLMGTLQTTDGSIVKCAAWNNKVLPPSTKIALANYSSGAVVGVTHPNCVLTDNYRNPAMQLRAYWVPSANYDHPNVNGKTAPLVRIGTDLDEANAAPATETSITGDAGRWAYHGKHVAAGTTLSTLASTTLGWSTDVWDFSGSLPTLVNNPEN